MRFCWSFHRRTQQLPEGFTFPWCPSLSCNRSLEDLPAPTTEAKRGYSYNR